MRRLVKDACVVAGVAAVTAAGIFAVARPRTAVAEGEAAAAPVERPALKVEGVVLTLVTDKQKYEAGERPVLTLTAVNAGARSASIDAVVSMLTTPQASMMMRMAPMPKEVWRRGCALDLAPGETRTVEIATDRELAAGQTATFNIAVGKETVTAAWLTVPGIKVLDAVTLAAALEKAKAQADAEPLVAEPEAR